jgi:hypothetical protein
LQASSLGLPVYERMGFAEVSRYRLFAKAMTGLAAAAPGGHWRLGDGGAVLAFAGALWSD